MIIGDKKFDTNHHTYVMGILNVTPDSFSDGGNFYSIDKALSHAEEMIEEGADIIDIGGESTKPGYTRISDAEEIARTVPIIKEIKRRFNITISIDTYKSEVAKACIDAGADMINDIWGLKYDDKIADVIASSGLSCCLMHNRKETNYVNFMKDVAADLAETIRIAERAGIDDEKIILDPGVGFAKSFEQNLEIINCLEELHVFGYPILLGTSRKSVIGLALDVPVFERIEGTLATTVIGVMKQCAFVRVHDVKENVRAIKMANAILYGK